MDAEVPVEWLCAVSRFRLGWTNADHVVSASANWLGESPESAGLLLLASASVSQDLRREEVDVLIDEAMADVGWTVADDRTYLWIAVVCTLASSPPPTAEQTASLLSKLALASDSDFGLLSEFIALIDYLDEGIPRDRVERRIMSAYAEVRSELTRRLEARLADSIYRSLLERWRQIDVE
ncbi:hypothetical protein ITJ43_14240 [Microbacterium sp. VKM Ac-2870]|uniref:hypothetical protein n=1 Tax=Microbacterium sp. VKM Ac-2870 TaxID=2783825 RepID=UPI00188B01F8|nr:hypothetical protein [Microbacterium sp. VKM Ac-2870]MBF4563290.1 hypothetical protein [Microbacterium sp. VKM Ac-2870]